METIQINIAYKIISMIISSAITYILLFKVLESNPLKVIANTFKKKIISVVIIFIVAVLISYFLENSNLNNYRIYSGIVMGIWYVVFIRIISTEKEVKNISKKEA